MTAHEMSPKNMILVKDKILHLQGDFTFRTVTDSAQKLEKLLTADIVAINCSAISKADSAAVALLLFAFQLAHRQQLSLKLIDITDALRNLMELYSVKEFLMTTSADFSAR